MNDVGPIFVLLTPVGLIYSWVFYWTRVRGEPAGWRSRAMLLSLVPVSLVILLWPAILAFAPRADWGTRMGAGRHVEWAHAWYRPVFSALLVAFVLSLFGRPRLILPIAVACIGTGLFWVMSTLP